MFYVIGLGLSDEKDITLRGLEVRTGSVPMKPDFSSHVVSGHQELNPGISGGVYKYIDD